MYKIGRTLFYDKQTGILIYDSGDTQTTIENYAPDYYEIITILKEREKESVGELKLDYGAYADDFSAGAYIERVDLETKEPLFIYPTPIDPEDPPTPQPSLAERLNRAERETAETKLAVEDLVTTMTELMMGGE